jgi:Leucine Rich repeats (2 copies)
MDALYTQKILSSAGLLKDYSALFNANQIEGEVWTDITSQHLLSIGLTNKRHIETILIKRDEILGFKSQPDFSIEEVKLENNRDLCISLSSVIRAARSQTKNKTDNSETVLRKVKSLDFSNKKLTQINNLNQCSTLQFLCLSNNSITQMSGLEQLTQLRILSIESNLIQKIENLGSFSLLEKLYLDMNYIQKLEGLEGLFRLEELMISNQVISNPMEIEENSIVAVSQSLKKLGLSGNKLNDISLLWYLDSLQLLDLTNNNIVFSEDLYKVLSCTKSLCHLKLLGNPVSKRPKYRDEMILWTRDLKELDDKNILINEKEYIYNLKSKRVNAFSKQKNDQNLSLEVKGNKLNN